MTIAQITRAERITILRHAIREVITAILYLDQLELRGEAQVLDSLLARLNTRLDILRIAAAEIEGLL